MSPLIKILPALALLAAAPALAQEPDPHADHHPPAAADAKAGPQGCPMHQQMASAGGKTMPHGMATNMPGGDHQPMMKGAMMQGGQHCMPGTDHAGMPPRAKARHRARPKSSAPAAPSKPAK
jgi:hypothetical protein